MFDLFSIIDWGTSSILNAATAVIGGAATVVGVADLYKKGAEKWSDYREQAYLKKYPLGPGEQHFYVKSTHAKYIMTEESIELIKVRVIRALKDVNSIMIDRAPAYGPRDAQPTEEPNLVKQEFYSIPGVALRRGSHYLVSLAYDQTFKAKRDHTYLISLKLQQKLDELHSDEEEDSIQILQPVGTERLVVEVHFPRTRKLTKIDGKVQLEVYAVKSLKEEPTKIDSSQYTINATDAIEPVPGVFTDMFRLTLPKPPQDVSIRVTWKWAKIAN